MRSWNLNIRKEGGDTRRYTLVGSWDLRVRYMSAWTPLRSRRAPQFCLRCISGTGDASMQVDGSMVVYQPYARAQKPLEVLNSHMCCGSERSMRGSKMRMGKSMHCRSQEHQYSLSSRAGPGGFGGRSAHCGGMLFSPSLRI